MSCGGVQRTSVWSRGDDQLGYLIQVLLQSARAAETNDQCMQQMRVLKKRSEAGGSVEAVKAGLRGCGMNGRTHAGLARVGRSRRDREVNSP